MNHASKLPALPALTVDLLQESGILIDNICQTLAADWYENNSKASRI